MRAAIHLDALPSGVVASRPELVEPCIEWDRRYRTIPSPAYSDQSDHRFQAIVNGPFQRISSREKPLRDFMITRKCEAREWPSTVGLSVHDVLESVITLPWKP